MFKGFDMLSNKQVFEKAAGFLQAIKTLPSRFQKEKEEGNVYSAFGKAALGGVVVAGIGYTTKSIAWPYLQQSGDLAIPEIFLIVAGSIYAKKTINFINSKTEGDMAPISARAGLLGGVMAVAVAGLPFREDYNDYWASVTQEMLSAEIAAEQITEFKNVVIRNAWLHSCPTIKTAIEASEENFGYVTCP